MVLVISVVISSVSIHFDQGSRTALMSAAGGGHHECLLILLAHGAEVDKVDKVSVVIACIE
jgi:hypothetical protein